MKLILLLFAVFLLCFSEIESRAAIVEKNSAPDESSEIVETASEENSALQIESLSEDISAEPSEEQAEPIADGTLSGDEAFDASEAIAEEAAAGAEAEANEETNEAPPEDSETENTELEEEFDVLRPRTEDVIERLVIERPSRDPRAEPPLTGTIPVLDDLIEEEIIIPVTLDEDITDLESVGLVSNPRENGLGRDLWNNSKRSEIKYLIQNLPVEYNSKTLRQLAHGLLITEANANLILNDVPIESGDDLLTLRIEKLMQMGLFKKAMDLFIETDREPYHPRLAEAGLSAMLLNSEKSLACVEYQTFKDRNFTGEFWDDLALYCNYVLGEDDHKSLLDASNTILISIGADEEYTMRYSGIRFATLPLFSKALLIAEERIDADILTTTELTEVQPIDVPALLSAQKLSTEHYYFLITKAHKNGQISYEDYERKTEKIAQDAEFTKSKWTTIPRLWLSAYKERNDDQQWELIKEALSLVDISNIHQLSPFAELINDLDPIPLTLEDVHKILLILNHAGKNADSDWIDIIIETNPTRDQEDLYASIYTYLALNLSNYNLSKSRITKLNNIFIEKTSQKVYFMKNVIETLDKFKQHIHNANKVYEKGFDFSQKKLYMLPQYDIVKSLKDSSSREEIATTVALSIYALHGVNLDQHYPGHIVEVIKKLNAVGFTHVTRELITEAFLKHETK